MNTGSHIPIYEQIVEQVCAALAVGVHRAGEPLPSTRVMAEDLVVNLNTVKRAYEELEQLGLVEFRRGLGMYVTENGGMAASKRIWSGVESQFRRGVAMGRAGELSDVQLRSLFDHALEMDRTPSEAAHWNDEKTGAEADREFEDGASDRESRR